MTGGTQMPIPNHMASIFSRPDPKQERYEQLRQVVTLGLANFRKTGQALREIKETELWRLDCKTWSECCKRHWDITPEHASRLIDAALFADRAEAAGLDPPTSERQARPLRSVPPEEQLTAWQEAIAEGATPQAIERATRKANPRVGNSKERPKPIRLKVPGASVIIEPNRRFQGTEQALRHALEILDQRSSTKAA